MAALSGGHLAVDFASGAVPAMLPLFKDRFGLSYALTAAIMLCATAASSLVQPLFGLFSDRRGALWLLPAGVGIAGIGTALAALTHVYVLVPVLDDEKHYWVGDDEVEKLLRHGEGWLAAQPSTGPGRLQLSWTKLDLAPLIHAIWF